MSSYDDIVDFTIEHDIIQSNSNINISNLIQIIEHSGLSSSEIMEKYNISSYRFYKIVHEYNLKPTQKRSVPKKTKFKQLLYGTEEEQKEAKIFPDGFVIEDFIKDSKMHMSITHLMSKYNLTLYQIRELRIQYDLKTK
jgi:hypothetical protein